MSESILDRIVDKIRDRLDAEAPALDLEARALEARNRRREEGSASFSRALATEGPSIIAECKKASPSAGLLRENFNPVELARSYEAGGAAAISVLVERDFFMGRPEWIPAVRKAVGLPIMRKDFIISHRQLLETVLLGADAVLLIQRILSPGLMQDLLGKASELDLEVLLEIFVDEDPGPAVDSGAAIIGVNARNLANFETRIDLVKEMAGEIPPDRIRVAESGIRCATDIRDLSEAGFDAMLIGETLVKSKDPEASLRELLGGSP